MKQKQSVPFILYLYNIMHSLLKCIHFTQQAPAFLRRFVRLLNFKFSMYQAINFI